MMRKVMNLALKMLNAILLAALFFTELNHCQKTTLAPRHATGKEAHHSVQPQGQATASSARLCERRGTP